MGGEEKTKGIIFYFLGSWAGSLQGQVSARAWAGEGRDHAPSSSGGAGADLSLLTWWHFTFKCSGCAGEEPVSLHQPQMSLSKAAGILMPICWEFLRNPLMIAVGRQIEELVLDLSLENVPCGGSSGFQRSPWECSITSGCPGLCLTSARQTVVKYK